MIPGLVVGHKVYYRDFNIHIGLICVAVITHLPVIFLEINYHKL